MDEQVAPTAPDPGRRSTADLHWLADLAETLSSTLDEIEVLSRLATLATESFADVAVVDLRDDTGGMRRVGGAVAAGVDLDVEEILRSDDIDDALPADSETVVTVLRGEVLRLDGPRMYDPLVLAASSRRLIHRLRATSILVLPMSVRGRVVGVVGLVRQHERPPFSAEDAALAGDIARRAALAFDNARLFREQREVALQLQQALLPQPTGGLKLEVAARYLPAQDRFAVGGDWFDAFPRPDSSGSTVLVVGDVSGHDLMAATTMAAMRNLLRGIVVATSRSCAGVVEAVDANLTTLGIAGTASLVLMTATPGDDGAWTLAWTNAGHPAPVLFAPDGDVELLDDIHGPLLGTGLPLARRSSVRRVPAGSTVVLYTDGLVERREESVDDGLARLLDHGRQSVALREHPHDLLEELLTRCAPSRADDVAVLVCHLP